MNLKPQTVYISVENTITEKINEGFGIPSQRLKKLDNVIIMSVDELYNLIDNYAEAYYDNGVTIKDFLKSKGVEI